MHLPELPTIFVKGGEERKAYFTIQARELMAAGWVEKGKVKPAPKAEPKKESSAAKAEPKADAKPEVKVEPKVRLTTKAPEEPKA